MRRLAHFCIILPLLCGCGAQHSPPSVELAQANAVDQADGIAIEVADDERPQPVAEVDDPAVDATELVADQEQGRWARINRLFESARASGQTQAENAAEWISEIYGNSKLAGAAAAEESSDWIQGLYEQAKDQGETKATSAKEWVMEDLNKRGAWQYKIVDFSSSSNEDAESQLNALGVQRWECYWVDQSGNSRVFYFKKQQRSFLSQVPAKELFRLVPLLGGAGEP